MQLLSGPAHRRIVCDAQPGENFSLGQVRGNESRERQQHFAHRRFGFRGQQAMTAFRNHYGIDHQIGKFKICDRPRDAADNFRIGKHAGFQGCHGHVVGDALDLRINDFRRKNFDSVDTDGILRRNGRNSGCTINTARSKCLKVCLNAGAAA